MGLGRGLRAGLTAAPAILAAVPLAALAAGATVDRGPSGEVRLTPFHLALTVLDPAVWESARNSLALAAATAAVAWVLGVALARTSRGRGAAWALALAPLAGAPWIAALGLRAVLGGLGLGPDSLGGWAGVLALGAAEATWAVPLVAIAAARGFAAIEPAWEDAARLMGGGGWRAWWRIGRPVVRPAAAGAVATVFALTLLEPGAPLVLGVRRTLAVQALDAALRPDGLNRAASLGLGAVLLAAAARGVLTRRGGRGLGIPPARATAGGPRRPPAGPAAAAGWLGLAAWLGLGAVPWLGVLALAVGGGPAAGTPAARPGLAEAFRSSREAGDGPALAAHSLAVGGVVAALGLLAAGGLARRGGGSEGGARARLARLPARMPPLAVAVGAAAVPGLLRAAAEVAPHPALEAGARRLAGALDPLNTPGVLLALVLLALHLAGLVAATEALGERSRPALFESARTLGLSRRRAWWSLAPRLVGPGLLAAWSRVTALAGLNVAAALVLTPTSAGRTLGPGLLDLAAVPGGTRPAAALALAATAVNLATLALAARRGPASLAEEPPR